MLSKENTEGITILNGCKNEAGENTGANPVVSVLEGEYKNKFKLTSNPKVQGTTLTLSDDYDIISSMEIQLTLQVKTDMFLESSFSFNPSVLFT